MRTTVLRAKLDAREGERVHVIAGKEPFSGVLWKHGTNYIARVHTGGKVETLHLLIWLIDILSDAPLILQLRNAPEQINERFAAIRPQLQEDIHSE